MHLAERLQNDKKRAWERWGKRTMSGRLHHVGGGKGME